MAAHQLIFLALMIAACAFAGARGGMPERMVAATFIAAALATLFVSWLPDRRHYTAIEIRVVLIDLAMFAVLMGIALRSARFWPMPMASMQGAELLAHLAKPLGSDVVPDAYYAIVAYWSYPMMALLIVGTLRHRRRLRIYHIDYAWAAALPPAYRAGGLAGER